MKRLSLRPASISGRLALLYTLGALLAVGVFALLANWKLEANFTAAHRDFLQAKAAELQDDLRDGDGTPDALIKEILQETAGARLRAYEARVLVAGKQVGETPGMGVALPADLFPAARNVQNLTLIPSQNDKGSWLLTSLPLHVAQGPKGVVLQIGLDITRDNALLTDFHRALAAFFLLMVPLLLVAGRLAAAHALAPLERIAKVAQSITPAQLSRRIPLDPPWPRELSGLVEIFNQMLDNLDASFKRLSRFSADIAHELRTPLSNFNGSLEVCLTRPRSEAEYRAAIASALEDGQRLTELIENLLFLARVENPSHALRHERCEADELCAWVTAQYEAQSRPKGLHIRIEGTATLYADTLLFRQAVGNVLANAVRHAPPASEISIVISGSPASGVEIAITDQGSGIPPEHLPRLFDRFYQTDPARGHKAAQGSGLGLSIVRSIMDLHGGRVVIESKPGQGTRVTLRFPPMEA
ncbi:heavy metal sensor histidine kinase [Acidocella aminolytica]|jgi:two-component system heavy metal sensor histidine kinase CusS|uniref:Sensor protein n=1 Tax=Acidocella aminolytica 101 = DSM 11237 TaxID=1120923 RepID=A0A0D6PIB3_9PROT|nr:heavy metal sensor histidine kinase [Acidocella aminolytica]GAN80948.1 heavy metal sensor signal transduction histidine kinase [Acidocella aminolytica 101 = DSM 11237]GBQ43323.1 signal transduction histidine kinase [Acidocella aminolytica 101 = DSM 11237]SHF31538.1 two-component system, OmpR family, heavy metal sensor histidine kinase CusS [Acidocella aminolytica 101 = DSM 11237]